MHNPRMTAQEAMMRGLAKSLREWASALSHHTDSVALTRGRMQGLALGLEAIAELARQEPPQEGQKDG